MKKASPIITHLFLPILIIMLPFLFASLFSMNKTIILFSMAALIFALAVYYFGLHRIDYNKNSKRQKTVIFLLFALTIVFSFFVCAISIEDAWVFDYPLERSVDDYGCYPQMFDAFKKGRLDIDTEFDLSVLESLENPYNPAARYEATGEKHGVYWDRTFFEGKLYSYFGIAPIFFIYFPFYCLTGQIPSDALAATLITVAAAIFLMLILLELIGRSETKVPFLLVLIGCITLPCGGLLWSSLTCANFYHIAVLFGIFSVCAFFLFLLKAEKSQRAKRLIYLALSGSFLATTIASRPNLIIYAVAAIPFFVSILKNNRNRVRSVLAFCFPAAVIGVLVMIYNYLRFGSVFDFGSAYQLTITDTSKYSLSLSLILPAIFHYFFHCPSLNRIFPYVHPVARVFPNYGKTSFVYLDKTVGALFFPAVWGIFLTPFVLKGNKKALAVAYLAVFSVFAVAFFDMCFGGVNLRYAADIMFVLTLLGVYILIIAVGKTEKGKLSRSIVFSLAVMLFAITVLVEIPLCFDNERDMILRYHPEFFKLFFR